MASSTIAWSPDTTVQPSLHCGKSNTFESPLNTNESGAPLADGSTKLATRSAGAPSSA